MGGDEVKYLLDTSVWLRAAISPHTIPQNELHFLQNEADDFAISIISVWEVGKKWQKGKLQLPSEYPIWLKQELRTNLRVLDLSPDLVQDAVSLPEFPNSDPADELIVATATS